MARKSRRPLIAVSGADASGRLAWWCIRLALWQAGARAVRLTPHHKTAFDRFQGFVLAGGTDINPALYHEASAVPKKQYDVERDTLEQDIFAYATGHNLPLLGICRGMQMMNICAGGSLYQEAGKVLEDFLPSQSLVSKIIGRRDVVIAEDSDLFHIMGQYKHYRVNSIHHQAVNEVGNGLRVVGVEKNKLVQAIEKERSEDIPMQSPGLKNTGSKKPDTKNINFGENPFVIGIQWHPEFMLHARSARRLFKAFVKAAKS